MKTRGALSLQRFEYGRHETFTIRHGWLSKGLARIQSCPGGGFLPDLETADALGLGSKMIKSLSYWLEASGLANAEPRGRTRHLTISPLGELISGRDPYFEYPGSWWFVHLFLATREGTALTWLFNDYAERSFDRTACTEAFLRHVRERALRTPSDEVAQRDVACVLSTYSDEDGKERDPEDGAASPLSELGLLVNHPDTRRFEKCAPLDRVPLEAVLGCIALIGRKKEAEAVSLGEMATERHGPGRILNMTAEGLEAVAVEAARTYKRNGVTFELLGGERRLRAAHIPPESWLACHYDRIGAH